jgi:hypothetical protein
MDVNSLSPYFTDIEGCNKFDCTTFYFCIRICTKLAVLHRSSAVPQSFVVLHVFVKYLLHSEVPSVTSLWTTVDLLSSSIRLVR